MPKNPKIAIPPGHVHCMTCGAIKPHTDFPRNAGGGRRRTCREHQPTLAPPAWKQREFADRQAARKRRAAGQQRAAANARPAGFTFLPAPDLVDPR